MSNRIIDDHRMNTIIGCANDGDFNVIPPLDSEELELVKSIRADILKMEAEGKKFIVEMPCNND